MVFGSMVPIGGSGIGKEQAIGVVMTTSLAISWKRTLKASVCDSGNRRPPLMTLTRWIESPSPCSGSPGNHGASGGLLAPMVMMVWKT
ncbi:hypothetical protein [Nannocystis pusilla]|uniref:hypothetical protein n=1 Tax=Nannocystis pusilla TaxID=889268 RepID=UPI003DA60098